MMMFYPHRRFVEGGSQLLRVLNDSGGNPGRARNCLQVEIMRRAEHSLEVRSEGLITLLQRREDPTAVVVGHDNRQGRSFLRCRSQQPIVIVQECEVTQDRDRPSIRGSPLMCQSRTPGRGYQSVNSGRPRFPGPKVGNGERSSSPPGFDCPTCRSEEQVIRFGGCPAG